MARLSTDVSLPKRSALLDNTLDSYLERLLETLEQRFTDIVRAVNENEGGPIVAESLPDPSLALQGRLVTTRGTGGSGEDQLFLCRADGAGGFELVEVTVT